MGTRPGEVDGMAVLRIAEDYGFDEATRLLNKESGLKGLGGTNDMAALLASDSETARFAVDHYCYWAARQAGSAIVAMGGVDAVAFTGGIGRKRRPGAGTDHGSPVLFRRHPCACDPRRRRTTDCP